MTIEQLAKQLGNAIKGDERLVRFNKAKEAFEADVALGRMAIEFEIQQKALANEYAKAERDEALITSIQKRAQELYDTITSSDLYKEMIAAEEDVNKLMNEVNSIITTEITGQAPCTHDCSTCGGHCHH